MEQAARKHIFQAYRADERQVVADLCSELAPGYPDPELVRNIASRLVVSIRKQRTGASGVDNLMREFSLSSQEGVALMCLAEALLRIPDHATANRLIRDKISKGDWRAHVRQDKPIFVNAAAWGLLISCKLVTSIGEETMTNTLSRVIAKGGEPLIRRGVDLAMRLLGRQFVMGESIESALARSRFNEGRGYSHSFDMLGEAAICSRDAKRIYRSYVQAIHAIGAANGGRGPIGGPGISIKLSALHPRYSFAQRDRVMDELLPRLRELLLLARQYDIGVNIDAEESDRLELSLELLEAVVLDPALAGWNGIGFVIQAYQKRACAVVDHVIGLARRSHRKLMIRLVKGAYWDSEIKKAQVDGLIDYPVFTQKLHCDLSYLACAIRLLEAGGHIYPQFATHNAQTVSSVIAMARDRDVVSYEFQCLHGMGEALYNQVVGDESLKLACRIYAPVGSHETLLPYLVRRLLENGANSSFVNRIVDDAVSIDALIADPLVQVRREGIFSNPAIPRPGMLYGSDRQNSHGLDLADALTWSALDRELSVLDQNEWFAKPLVADADNISATEARSVLNPARRQDKVGFVSDATAEHVELALSAATQASIAWRETSPSSRANVLETAANIIEQHRAEFISLCMREAGKTAANAVAEIREAIDFCRYYAWQVRGHGDSSLATAAPGVIVCISPWNFPLAIFLGEVAAGLAAGYAVLAKPAEQTVLVAHLAVRLMHEAGVPVAVLQLLPGPGETIGAMLTADKRVDAVIFTGSTEVGRVIYQTLSARMPESGSVRLIAETGGQNVMVVDSSALLEQVVQDVLVSGFDSAGQRCSALRILAVQSDIADDLKQLLQQAMSELRVGNPRELRSDIGPVIDESARLTLEAHITALRAAGRDVFQIPLSSDCGSGFFVSPTLIEIGSLNELAREVFGPVVHFLRFKRIQLPRLLDEINALGYGLTFGVHSRIDETVDQITSRVRAGNIYVNRNMVGAVVGVQPFGGLGLSGTGPKAGGPLYLHHLTNAMLFRPSAFEYKPVDVADERLGAFAIFTDWVAGTANRALLDICSEYRRLTPLSWRIDLPGPTGETNCLTFTPRGSILCAAEDELALLHQVAASLATGNQVTLVAGEATKELLARFPESIMQHFDLADASDIQTANCAVVLCDRMTASRTEVFSKVASQPGAIVPVLVPDDDSRYALYRLVAEKVVSVNTTAAGGNATLMTLAT